MKTYLKRLILLITVISLTSCASGPTFDVFKTTIPDLNPDTGRVYIYRLSTFGGVATQPDVMFNGEKIGEAVVNGFFYVDRPAGSYEIMTSTEVDRKLSFTLGNNQTRYIRLRVSLGFFREHVYPALVEEQEALEEIKYCKYSQSKKDH